MCVIMNPPFRSQVAFFNHASTFQAEGGLSIVWVAGCGVRWFDNEAKLHPSMHLRAEWGVERAKFAHAGGERRMHVCVQVWVRRGTDAPRRLPCPSLLPFPSPLRFSVVASEHTEGDVVVRRVGSVSRVGEFAVVEGGAPPNPHKHALGTFSPKGGTAYALRCDDVEARAALVGALSRRRGERAYELCLSGRHSGNFVSLTMRVLRAILSDDWRSMVRPLLPLPPPREE